MRHTSSAVGRIAFRLAAVAVTTLAGCGPASSSTTPTEPPPSVAPSAIPATPSPSPATPAGTLSCLPATGGTETRARVTDMFLSTTSTEDTLTIRLDTAVPQYRLRLNPAGVVFAGGGGKGGTFRLAGQFGVQLDLMNLNWTDPPGDVYAHGTDITQAAPVLVEARQIGDYEGIDNIAIGLAGDVCPTVVVTEQPPSLVITFPHA